MPAPTPGSPEVATGTRWESTRAAMIRLTAPAETGLPRWPVLLWFPALLTVLFGMLVVLSISGSSTGMFWQLYGSGTDPELLSGTPRGVRSDEWLTFGSWVVSQSVQGFPPTNQGFPGGIDFTVHDLPSWDWAMIFRPHTVGFMLLGLDHGMAVRWWLPGFGMMAACYCMLISLLPRRPATSAVISVAFFYSPMLNWWYLPSILLPSALCFLVIAAVCTALRDPRRWVRITWAAVTGYVSVCTLLTLYPPFIVPAVLVALAVCCGALFAETNRGSIGLRPAISALVPLLVAGAAAGLIVLVFILTRSGTIAAISNTIYPGQRLEATGGVSFNDLIAVFGAPFDGGLNSDQTYDGVLGTNASEASAPVLLGLFLIIPLVWFVVHDWRQSRRIQWMILGCAAVTVVLAAFLLIPGWDPIAHLLLLDRTTKDRVRMGLGLVSVVAIALLVKRLDEGDTRVPWAVTWTSTWAAAASVIVVWTVLARADDPALTRSEHHLAVAGLFVLSVLLYNRGRALLASVAFLIVSVVLSFGINPFYRGTYDLTETSMGQAVERVNAARPGTWLGIGSYQLGSVLVETGVQTFNGVQLYPSTEMWREVDPTGQYADVWNRFASIAWEPGTGEPRLLNPQADVVIGSFDSCSGFAQQHVTYVMTQSALDQPCLEQIDQASQGASTYLIYQVTR